MSINDVSKEQRNTAKTINFRFALRHGCSAFGRGSLILVGQRPKKFSQIFCQIPRCFGWKNEALSLARKNNEVRTLFGRKRLVPELSSQNAMLRARAERLAINTPIQGSNADIIKKAMIDTDIYLRESFPNAHLIMQVHDELVIEAPEKEAEKITDMLKNYKPRPWV